MNCNLAGAVIRRDVDDPDSAYTCVGGSCHCSAKSLYDGCAHFRDGTFEKVPTEWPPISEKKARAL